MTEDYPSPFTKWLVITLSCAKCAVNRSNYLDLAWILGYSVRLVFVFVHVVCKPGLISLLMPKLGYLVLFVSPSYSFFRILQKLILTDAVYLRIFCTDPGFEISRAIPIERVSKQLLNFIMNLPHESYVSHFL